MRTLLFFLLCVIPLACFSQERCVPEEEYKNLFYRAQIQIDPVREYRAKLSELSMISLFLPHIDPAKRENLLPYYIDLADLTASALYSMLSFIPDYESKLASETVPIIESILETQAQFESEADNNGLKTLLEAYGHNKPM